MESIFHEKQEGSLCAQHCLNNLLQGEYFSPVELSSIAQQLDEEERMRMAEGGVQTEEYRTFLQQPSGNMDDSGFFSIQVISNALGVWGLEIVLFNSREYQQLRIDPIHEKAFICNYKEHWFTVRKLGQQWFNLNSLLTGPELISDTYLALFLAQLQQEGYSIFVIRGNLPDCEADQILRIMRVEQQQRPKLIGEDEAQRMSVQHASDAGHTAEEVLLDEDEEELRKALALSRQDMEVEDEEADLRRAIQMSMQGGSDPRSPSATVTAGSSQESGSGEKETLSAEELRRRRQAYFDRQQAQSAAQDRSSAAESEGKDSGSKPDQDIRSASLDLFELNEVKGKRFPRYIPLPQTAAPRMDTLEEEAVSAGIAPAFWDHWGFTGVTGSLCSFPLWTVVKDIRRRRSTLARPR
ncbi:hypothetical protein QQF64_011711 [Cirrhinus molitorella]|uniref:ubiquitinyl hydrolase 1 n=2 Tax=Cirrhinus molitorella TaxID=172907 RepID=A0ABR3M017_9TELE